MIVILVGKTLKGVSIRFPTAPVSGASVRED